jgi:HAD superfamily hydrolase (TIGR01509 family)
MFDFGYTSWQLKLRKPDPQIYQAVLTLQNLKPEEVVFIDDTPKNVDSAKSLGIESILFTDNAQFLNSLKLLEI